jgi:hypothetical protein
LLGVAGRVYVQLPSPRIVSERKSKWHRLSMIVFDLRFRGRESELNMASKDCAQTVRLELIFSAPGRAKVAPHQLLSYRLAELTSDF